LANPWSKEWSVPPYILSTREVYRGWTTIRQVKVRLDTGDAVVREVEDHGNAAAVLPFDAERRTAILIRILRVAAFLTTGQVKLLECPAGLVEEANSADTARREAYEEVGVVLHEIEHAGRVWTAPGISSEMMDLYLAPYSAADRIHVGGGLPTEHEQIDVVELGLDELWSMAQRNEIEDLKTLTLVLLLKIRRPELFGA
jgi:nudix-type nucleoside diphosphatase (YffH/AdpP family)